MKTPSLTMSSGSRRAIFAALGLGLACAVMAVGAPAHAGHVRFNRYAQPGKGAHPLSSFNRNWAKEFASFHSSRSLSYNFATGLGRTRALSLANLRLPKSAFSSKGSSHLKPNPWSLAVAKPGTTPTYTTDTHTFGSGNPSVNVPLSGNSPLSGLSGSHISTALTLTVAPASVPPGVSAVPEPASLVMMGIGTLALVGLSLTRRLRTPVRAKGV